MERISGPHLGYYVASYACEAGGPGERFLGYAKICRRRPESYWDASCLVKLCGERLHLDAEAALQDVEAVARLQMGNLAREPSAAVA